jgi:hypothetical protein
MTPNPIDHRFGGQKEVERRHAETAVRLDIACVFGQTALTIHLPSPCCPAISLLHFVTAFTEPPNLLRYDFSPS